MHQHLCEGQGGLAPFVGRSPLLGMALSMGTCYCAFAFWSAGCRVGAATTLVSYQMRC